MTGRDLIVYILEHGLEDEDVFKNGTFVGFMNEEQAAAKFNVGVATLRVWYFHDMLDGFTAGGSIFIPADAIDPRERKDK